MDNENQNEQCLTLGSLFDGSGGFPLGGSMAGIKPLWASEIEPFPIRVTTKRFPDMKHYGDVSKMNGGEIPPVDVITFGSPCFPAGTMICTDNGLVSIEKITVGTKVLTHKGNYKPVTAIGNHKDTTIKLSDGTRYLECTKNHPIYSNYEGTSINEWVHAENMKDRLWAVPISEDNVNDAIIVKTDELHNWYRVKDIKTLNEIKTVYNLTVEEDNSYIADGIVVHNCQDMSIAGKRAGLEGERSGLFYQAIRIIKEMREATNGKYPRYIVWENVPGAFSSNKGEDFGCVLDEICSIGSTEDIHVPRPKKWNHAGYIMGKDYSVAWRVLDALGFGVPQRRKRIYLVGDLDGGSAGKILFESEGMSGYSAEGFRAWKEASRCPEICIGESDSSMCVNDDVQSDMKLFDNHRADCRYRGPLPYAPSVLAYYGTGGVNTPLVVEPYTMRIRCGKPGGEPAICIQGSMIGRQDKNGPLGSGVNEDVSFTLNATDRHAVMYNEDEFPCYSASKEGKSLYIARRLTPVECCRLQGFPDWWCCGLSDKEPSDEDMSFWKDVFETYRLLVTHSKKPKTDKQIRKWLAQPYSDSAAYKMWGNGVALPCVWFVLSGIVWAYKNNI